MKTLLLLRHAKTVPHGTAKDFDRVLTDRGRSDMALIAPRLAALDPRPDLALVSPAARTRQTWELCGFDGTEVRWEKAIYEASLETLLRLVRALPDEARLPILVGHNPAFEEFAGALAGDEPLGGLPTGSVVCAEWSASSWREVDLAAGRRVWTLTPSSIGGGRRGA